MDYQVILDQISEATDTPKPKVRTIIREFLNKIEHAALVDESFAASGYIIRHEALSNGEKRSILRKVK